jgi:hypothetical protein
LDQSSKVDPFHKIQPHDFLTEEDRYELLIRDQLADAQREARIAHEKRCIFERENRLLNGRIQCLEYQLAKKKKKYHNIILCLSILPIIVVIILTILFF